MILDLITQSCETTSHQKTAPSNWRIDGEGLEGGDRHEKSLRNECRDLNRWMGEFFFTASKRKFLGIWSNNWKKKKINSPNCNIHLCPPQWHRNKVMLLLPANISPDLINGPWFNATLGPFCVGVGRMTLNSQFRVWKCAVFAGLSLCVGPVMTTWPVRDVLHLWPVDSWHAASSATVDWNGSGARFTGGVYTSWSKRRKKKKKRKEINCPILISSSQIVQECLNPDLNHAFFVNANQLFMI